MNIKLTAAVGLCCAVVLTGLFALAGCSRQPRFEGPRPREQESPRALLRKWYSAIDGKDRKAFYECYWGTDEIWADTIDALYSSHLATLGFRRALAERFGADAWERYKQANNGLGIVVKTPPPDDPSWVDDIEIRSESENRAVYLPYPNEEVPALNTWQTMIRRDGIWVLAPPERWNADEASHYLQRVTEAMKHGEELVSKESMSLVEIKKSISKDLGYRVVD